MYVDWILNRSVYHQFQAFYHGFHSVCASNALIVSNLCAVIYDKLRWLCVEGRGRISRLGLTKDIKMGSNLFQYDVSHQWIAQRQVGLVSVQCDGVGCHVLCLWHGIFVWQHIGQSTTATSRHCRNMKSDV